MKNLFDKYSSESSKAVTKMYSTSFFAGVSCLDKKIQNDIHAVYGFVRFADEIVDSFDGYNKAELLDEFKAETFKSISRKISLNPILNSFQATVNKYKIDHDLIEQFLHSMEMDLVKVEYTPKKYDEYILGSAQVVGLMCLKIFVYGDEEMYEKLKPFAMKLGSSFQKINFLRDFKDDMNLLDRAYFPNLKDRELNDEVKLEIEQEIQEEFNEALTGIKMLPKTSRFGVYLSYKYYTSLLKKIKKSSANDLMEGRIRVANSTKLIVFAKSRLRDSLNIL
jgi:phytoene/squalene synthetase